MTSPLDVKKIGMIGCGSMGGGMAMLFAEKGLNVSLSDPSEDAINKIIKDAEKEKFGDRVHKSKDYKDFCGQLGTPKVIVFSLPHGDVGDKVLAGLLPYLKKGDIILDAGNENYTNTERRQGQTCTKGIRYVGVGVSGGYQAARRGPSMCPGADEQTLEMIMPLLEKVAAKDKDGKPCVARCGLGGSGHYVKMIHNGIEHGMMSAIAEAWKIMSAGLGMSDDEIGDVFQKWNEKGELAGTFLIKIGADVCRATAHKEHVLDTVQDKVVQDLTGEEGTGVWSNMEAVRLHVPAPTLSTAHYLRIASAFRGQRVKVAKEFGGEYKPQKLDVEDKAAFVELLRRAVYTTCLASYVQGIRVIEEADEESKWCIDYAAVWQIWRGGCIIQADYIAELIAPVMKDEKRDDANLLLNQAVADDLKKGKSALQQVVLKCIMTDHIVPSMSATLEWVKYQTNTELPASFYEAELDYFGAHMFDTKGEDAPGPTKGKHHYEWKPA